MANFDAAADLVSGHSFAKNIGKNITSSALEGGAGYTLDYLADVIAGNPDAQFDWDEFANSIKGGAGIGAAFGTGAAAIGAMGKAIDLPLPDRAEIKHQPNVLDKNTKFYETNFPDGKSELTRKKGESHRRTGEGGRKIIDKPTYNKLTQKFVSNGGIIIRGEDAKRHLGENNAASYLSSLNSAFIRDDATISDVLEEMYHAEQDRKNMFGDVLTPIVAIKREIDAQRYLLSVTEKYKIPIEETEITKRNLEIYEKELQKLLKEEK